MCVRGSQTLIAYDDDDCFYPGLGLHEAPIQLVIWGPLTLTSHPNPNCGAHWTPPHTLSGFTQTFRMRSALNLSNLLTASQWAIWVPRGPPLTWAIWWTRIVRWSSTASSISENPLVRRFRSCSYSGAQAEPYAYRSLLDHCNRFLVSSPDYYCQFCMMSLISFCNFHINLMTEARNVGNCIGLTRNIVRITRPACGYSNLHNLVSGTIFGPPPQTTCLGPWPRGYGDYFFLAGPFSPTGPSRGLRGPSLRHWVHGGLSAVYKSFPGD